MSQDFQSQLEAFVNEAAEKAYPDIMGIGQGSYRAALKQGCDLLIPVLMRAIEQRDGGCKAFHQNDIVAEYELNLCDEDLLNILKGE